MREHRVRTAMFHGVAVSAAIAALGHVHDVGGMVVLVAIAAFARALRHGGLGTGVVLGTSAALGSVAAWILGASDAPSVAFTAGGIATIGFGIATALADIAIYLQSSSGTSEYHGSVLPSDRSGPEQSRYTGSR